MVNSANELANNFEPVNGPTPVTTIMFIIGLLIIAIFFTRTSKHIIKEKVSAIRLVFLSPALIYFYIIIVLIIVTLFMNVVISGLLGVPQSTVQAVIDYLNSVSWVSEVLAFFLACLLGYRYSMLEKGKDWNYRKILFFTYLFAYEISSVFSYMHTTAQLAFVFSGIAPIIVGVLMERIFAKNVNIMLQKPELFQDSMFVLPLLGLIVTLSKSVVLYLNTGVAIDKVTDRYLTHQNMIFGFAVIGYCFISAIIVSRNIENISLVEEKNVELIETNNRIHKLTLEMLNSLVSTIEAKDEYTSGHSQRVANYAKLLAAKMGMSEEEINRVYMYALLHDIGKIGIPNAIINKPSKLTDDEYEVIKSHPKKGADILKGIEEYPDIYLGAFFHHERWDGKGYPNQLKGEEIPLIARIIAVADSYDAMTSRRSYRPPMEQQKVRDEIVKGKGTQFDATIAEKMLEIIDDDKDYNLKQQID